MRWRKKDIVRRCVRVPWPPPRQVLPLLAAVTAGVFGIGFRSRPRGARRTAVCRFLACLHLDRVLSGRERGRGLHSRQPLVSVAKLRIERLDLPATGGVNASFTSGFQAGYNYQAGPAVLGFETDFDYLDYCRSGTFAAPPAYAPLGMGSYTLSGVCSFYFGTMRGRLGYAFDPRTRRS